MLNINDDSEHTCSVPRLKEKISNILLLSMIFMIIFLFDSIYNIKEISLYILLAEIFKKYESVLGFIKMHFLHILRFFSLLFCYCGELY